MFLDMTRKRLEEREMGKIDARKHSSLLFNIEKPRSYSGGKCLPGGRRKGKKRRKGETTLA